MTVPGQVSANSQSEVCCILDSVQLSVMDLVVLFEGSSFVGDHKSLKSALNCISKLCSQSCSFSRSSWRRE